MNIYYEGLSFEPSETNPYDENKAYGVNWIMLKLRETADYFLFTGRGRSGIFQVIITKRCSDWQYRIMDFLGYERSYDKNIIAVVSEHDLEDAKSEYEDHSYMDRLLRPYEQRVLVHSTTFDCWQSIKKDGCLKSWNLLKLEGDIDEVSPIGEKLGDPYDYSDYIMFTNGGASGEMVVSSKQKGRIDMNIDTPYNPGARLYFDAQRIADDGLLVRDGAHVKVKDELPLDKYLIWAATADMADLYRQEITPRKFADVSDRLFQARFGITLIQLGG